MVSQLSVWCCKRCGATLAVVNEQGEFTLHRATVHGDQNGLQIVCPRCQQRNIWECLDKSQRSAYNQNVS